MNIFFGGTGFIGIHYAMHLLSQSDDTIVLADIKDVLPCFRFPAIEEGLKSGRIVYIKADVRDRSSFTAIPAGPVSRIFNFAAIHREPGHEHHEYYETNIPGADNVCAWAEERGCNSIVFTSSIAVYEPTTVRKDESTVPAPISAYGGSKLAAELIHRTWQAKDPTARKLVMVRPGVVYGPSEGGNVTRMLKMVDRGLFVFIGNRDTRKASIYVKELIAIMEHLLSRPEMVNLSNAVVPVPPSMGDYIAAIDKATGKKHFVPNLPYHLVHFLSYFVALVPPVAKKTGIDPMRVKKLRRINNIESHVLPDTGYTYKYTLESAFADWYKDCIVDWKK